MKFLLFFSCFGKGFGFVTSTASPTEWSKIITGTSPLAPAAPMPICCICACREIMANRRTIENSPRVLHIVFVEFCWAMEILNFNRKLAMGLSLCFSCRISEIGSLWICNLFSPKTTCNTSLLKTLLHIPKKKMMFAIFQRAYTPEIYHRYQKLPFLKGELSFPNHRRTKYGYIPKASFPNIFGMVNFWGPESPKGVKFVPLNHQKQTWGLKFDTLGGPRYPC